MRWSIPQEAHGVRPHRGLEMLDHSLQGQACGKEVGGTQEVTAQGPVVRWGGTAVTKHLRELGWV